MIIFKGEEINVDMIVEFAHQINESTAKDVIIRTIDTHGYVFEFITIAPNDFIEKETYEESEDEYSIFQFFSDHTDEGGFFGRIEIETA